MVGRHLTENDDPPADWPKPAPTPVEPLEPLVLSACDALDTITHAPSLLSLQEELDKLRAKVNELVQLTKDANINP